MYAASSFALGAVTQAGAMTGFAQAWVWVAAAVCWPSPRDGQ
jgi:hypothetical protein